MDQERFDELQNKLNSGMAKLAKAEAALRYGQKPMVELSSDLSTLVVFITEAVSKIEAGGKSRPRSIAMTKLQEASFWLNEEMRTS